MKITSKETLLLLQIALNEYNACNGDMPDDAGDTACYSDCLSSCYLPAPLKPLPDESVAGVMSSICKKGLAYTDGENVCLTSKGLVEAKRIHEVVLTVTA